MEAASTQKKQLLAEKEHASNDLEGNCTENSAQSLSQTGSSTKRRRRKSKKGTNYKPELDNELSDDILEEFTLGNENQSKNKPHSAAERIEMKKNKEKAKSPDHVDEKEHSNNEQEEKTPGGSCKNRRKRRKKKKRHAVDGGTAEKGENASLNTTSATNCLTPRNDDILHKTPVRNSSSPRNDYESLSTTSVSKNVTPRNGNGFQNSAPRSRYSTPRNGSNSPKAQSPHSKKKCYEKYWSAENVSAGLKRGELKQGTVRINKKNYEIAWVTIDGMRRDIVIDGMLARNRALEGDVVALLISPREKWKVMKDEYGEFQAKQARGEDRVDDVAASLHEMQLSPSKDVSSPVQKADVPDEFLQQTAKVVYVIEKKHSRAAGGLLKPFNAKSKATADGLFIPTDSRLPRLRIRHDDCPSGFYERPQDFANSLFVARITEWSEISPLDNFLAKGKIMRSLGEAGEIVPETEAIFTEYEIDYGPFPEEALVCLPQTPWVIPEEELAKRRDFRDECVFTIDPLTARDLDDALHCKRLENGNIEVGVHIADVSYFVRQGTALDEVAQARATSTYMVQTVVPMLPRLLCEELCSLNPDVDRLTMSVVWTMNDKGEILSDWKGRSVIRSRVKLAYEHAHDMIQTPNKQWEERELPPISQGTDASEIASKVVMLHKIAVKLRHARFEKGALRLDQAKLQFDLDRETGMPDGYHVHQQRDSNKMIEEFMLLANMAVAHHIYNAFPKISLLRRHPKPGQRQLDELAKMCANHGIAFNIQSSKSLQQSLNKFPLGSAKREILVLYTMKPMKNAMYFCSGSLEEEQFGHYALSVPFYTHFTSPIRRYPDVIVHRLLAASLDLDERVDEQNYDMDYISKHCNDRKSAAKHAGELSIELFFALFVRECGPLEEDGLVSAVMDQSFDVFVPALGVTKRIYCKFCSNLKHFEHIKNKETNQASLKLMWEAEKGADIEQDLSIFTEVGVILTTENQGAEKDEKSKRLKVYGQLVPPPGTKSKSKVQATSLPKDEMKKALFQDVPNLDSNKSNSDDDVIIEEVQIIQN